MRFEERVEKWFSFLLPTPFTIAVVLTLIAFVVSMVFGNAPAGKNFTRHVLESWYNGLWNIPLLAFSIQMMLMLVLGNALALSTPVDKLIQVLVLPCTNGKKAAFIVTLSTVAVSLFNWGLGLIFGAILARKVGENASRNNIPLNYALIGACGYSGLMVWHGGLSGSAPLKVAETGHFLEHLSGVIPQNTTLFSPMNLTVAAGLLVLLPLFAYFLGRNKPSVPSYLKQEKENQTTPSLKHLSGAALLDASKYPGRIIGIGILLVVIYLGLQEGKGFLSMLTPDYINLLLMGLSLMAHGSFYRFLHAIDRSIGSASGILIQFPLYFGIMGIMNHTGLIGGLSEIFVQIASVKTLPIFTFFSAALVNIFVPSGGGQWAVQGPVVIEAALSLGVGLPKMVMALAYGDQLTNMLQPFWALPLLGITGLKAKELLPYTFLFFLVGGAIFTLGLLVF